MSDKIINAGSLIDDTRAIELVNSFIRICEKEKAPQLALLLEQLINTISEKGKGRKPTPMSEEAKKKLSKMKKGVARDKQVIKKMMVTREKNQSFVENNNPNSKKFVFISPEGNQYVVEGRFKTFCNENNISYYGLQYFKKTGRMIPSCKGWRVFIND